MHADVNGPGYTRTALRLRELRSRRAQSGQPEQQSAFVRADAFICASAILFSRTVRIVDDVPRRERPHGARIRFLTRPFSAHALIKEVARLLE